MSEEFSVLELLAWFDPKAIDYSRVTGASHIHLTPQDIAARLSQCRTRGGALFGRALLHSDNVNSKEFKEFYYHFMVVCAGLPAAREVTKKRRGQFSALVNVVVWEFMKPDACPWCIARGEPSFTVTERGIIPCSACGGTGKTLWSDKKRARLANIPESTFRKNLIPLHIQMVETITGFRDDCISALKEIKHKENQRHARLVASPPQDEPPPPMAA